MNSICLCHCALCPVFPRKKCCIGDLSKQKLLLVTWFWVKLYWGHTATARWPFTEVCLSHGFYDIIGRLTVLKVSYASLLPKMGSGNRIHESKQKLTTVIPCELAYYDAIPNPILTIISKFFVKKDIAFYSIICF